MVRARLREDQIRDRDNLSEWEHDVLVHESLVTSGTLNFQDGTLSGTGDAYAATYYGDGSNLSGIDHGTLSGLGDDDHSQYSLVDGTRAFTGKVGGVTPTSDAHLTTKQYVDDEITASSGTTDHTQLSNIGTTTHSGIDTHIGDGTIHFTEASIDKYTQAEVDDLITTATGSLSSNHSELDQLDYASAGHTGFQVSGDYATNTQLTTTSGDIVDQIPTDFYTTSEVDSAIVTFSGTIDHDTIINNHNLTTDIDHDALTNFATNEHFTEASIDKYTQAEVDSLIDTVSGSLVDGYTAADTVITNAYIAADVILDTKIDTASGTLQSQITSNDGDISINTSNIATNSGTQASHAADATIHFTEASIDKYTQAEVDDLITTATGSLSSNHSELDELDYASAGHTGFQPAGDYVTDSEMTTISGDLVSGYTAADVVVSNAYIAADVVLDTKIDTTSGTLQAELDALDYYTQAEVASEIATFSGTIDHDTILNNHNLTTDIDHDQLTNFDVNEHLLTAAIDHDSLLNFASNEHFTEASIDKYTQNEVDNLLDFKYDKTGGIIAGDVTIQGDLTVTGTQFIAQVEEVKVEDNMMTLNYGEPGAGVTAGVAGIEIDRGSETNYRFVFDEAADHFEVGVSGSEQAVATREDSPTDTYVTWWDDGNVRLSTVGSAAISTVLDKYTQAEVDTISGSLVNQMITDHGALTGLGDDDHTQYILVDGTREFTGTVSGVDATQPEHLVTYNQLTESSGTLQIDIDNLYGIHYDMQEPTGFFNRTDSVISFDDGSLTFTISGTEYEFYTIGIKHTKNGAESIAITDVEGIHHIYYDVDGTIKHTTIFTDDIILRYAYITGIYWDATNKKHILFAEERHGFVMDGGTHLYLHTTVGAVYDNGLGLTSIISNGNGNLDIHAQLGYGSGRFWDEDIDINITGAVAPAQIPVYYKEGIVPVWRADVANSFPVKSTGTRLAYNSSPGGVWGQTEASNQDFVLCHLFATNDVNRPFIAVQGEAVYTNISAAQVGANDEMLSLTTGAMPVKEFIPVATVIYQTSSTYNNSVNARIRPTSEGADYVDWRFSTGGGGVGLVSDHGSLSGLDDDDHVQYSLVDGTRDFTAPVGGVDATQPEHLVTYNQLTTTSGDIIDYVDSKDDSQNEFIELIDTPTTYSGLTGYHPAIKSSEDGLEFSLYSEPDLYIETTRSGNSVTYVDAWRDNSKTFQTYKETITRAGGFVSQVVTDIFDVTDGVTITDTYTNTFVRSGGFVVSETQVRT